MLKFFKRIFQILAGLIVIVILATIGVVNFVNPNQFKGLIESETLKHSGHILKLNGPLNWRWYPILALELQDVTFENAEPFVGSLLTAKTASLDCAFASIFSGRVLLNLKFQGLNLALKRDAKGNENWSLLQRRFASPKESSTQNNTPSKVLVNSLKLEGADVSFQDSVNKESYEVKNLQLSTDSLYKGILGIKTPISFNFDFETAHQPSLNIDFATQWSLKFNPKKVNFNDMVLQCKSADGSKIALKGEAEVQELDQNPLVTATLESHEVDVSRWLQILKGGEQPALPLISVFKTNIKYQSSILNLKALNITLANKGAIQANLSLNVAELTHKTLNLSGNIAGSQLEVGTIKIKDIKSDIKSSNGVITFAPILLQIADIQQKATLKIDPRENTPKFYLTHEASDFEMNSLLGLFGVKDKLEGKATSTLNLNATGSSPNEWRKTLHGDLKIAISKGRIHGIDLLKLLKSAQSNVYKLLTSVVNKQDPNSDATLNAEVEKWNSSGPGNNSTPFDLAKASANIAYGLLTNPDLLIDHADYQVNGSGTLNIPNETVQYQASVMLKNNPYPASDQVATYLYQIPLPISVQGSIHDPIIRPDLKNYFNSALKITQKQLVEKAVETTVKKTLNKALGNLLKSKQE